MNVLSIDFDIIMAPDINLYNAMVGTSPDGSRSVEERIKEYPILAGCRADLQHYQRMVSYLLEKVTKHLKVEDIYITHSHENIKYVLEGLSNVHVYNIDHHHDLGYPQDEHNGDTEGKCTCANWGEYFLQNNTITHLTWLSNSNSGPVPPHFENDNRVDVQLYQQTELEKLPKMDKLFICLSPEWTLPMYHPLFYTILDLINNQKGCHLEIN
jgi:hypothetical protein